MALIAQKRPRPSRTAKMRPAPPLSSRVDDLLRDQSLLLRWVLSIAAVLLLAVVVEAWKAPFPYRLGDYAADGIAARIEFRREDQYNTKRARDDRAEKVSPILRLDAASLEPLSNQLRQDLESITQAESLEDVPSDVRNAIGLTVVEGGNDEAVVRAEFAALKAALSEAGESAPSQAETIVKAFDQVIAELRRSGVVTADELKRNGLRTDGTIAIARPGRPDLDEVPVDTVLLAQIASREGWIGRVLETDPELSAIANPLRRWITRKSIVTLRYDDARTQEARREAEESVVELYNTYNPGYVLVAPGNQIDENALDLLRVEHATLEDQTPNAERIARTITVLVMISVLAVLVGYYFRRNERQLFSSSVRLSIYLGTMLCAIALGRFLSFDPWRAEVIPLLAVVTVMAIAYDQLLATITAFTLSSLLILSTTGDLAHFISLMAVSAAAIIPLSAVDSRSKLIKVGFLTAIVYFAVSIGLGVLERQSLDNIWTDPNLLKRSFLGAFWCLVASYLVAGSLPFVESIFGVVTDISLLEMTDVSHPLLQELVRRAPGTYNHSMAVATIGETAADAIGANGLLVRVGAYFHDVGKMLKPHYFVENMTEGQRSRHEQLAPAMSTLIIIGHVKDGADLAREHNLPRRIIDFIEQHHGTTLVEYFYREATRLADQTPDHKSDAEESAFRYPGPKPQTKEAGVMMLSDAVESASRTLSEPTPKRIESLVRGISLKRLLDGQFDQSGLTLSEIRTVEDSLIKSLIGIYHGRIKYPDQKAD